MHGTVHPIPTKTNIKQKPLLWSSFQGTGTGLLNRTDRFSQMWWFVNTWLTCHTMQACSYNATGPDKNQHQTKTTAADLISGYWRTGLL
jgi:hypothetical protein